MGRKIGIGVSVVCGLLTIAMIVILVISGVQGRTFGSLVGSWFSGAAPASPGFAVPGGNGLAIPTSPAAATENYQYTDRQERLMVTAAGYPTAGYKVQTNTDDQGYLLSITVTVPSTYTQVTWDHKDVTCTTNRWVMSFGAKSGGKRFVETVDVSASGLSKTWTAAQLFGYNGAPMDQSEYSVYCTLKSGSMPDVSTDGYTISIASADSLPVPTKEGYTFGGWYMDEACTVPYNGSPILGDITLYAKMTINRYTVTYDVMGGDAMDAVILDWGSTINPPAPTREGYDFQGWYNGDVAWSTDTPVKSDITLTAHWSIKRLTVNLMVDGAIWQTLTVDYGKRFGAILSDAGLLYSKCVAVVAADGSELEGSNDMRLQADNVTLKLVPMTAAESAETFCAANWITLVGIIVGAVATIVLAVILSRKQRA